MSYFDSNSVLTDWNNSKSTFKNQTKCEQNDLSKLACLVYFLKEEWDIFHPKNTFRILKQCVPSFYAVKRGSSSRSSTTWESCCSYYLEWSVATWFPTPHTQLHELDQIFTFFSKAEHLPQSTSLLYSIISISFHK